MEQRIKRDISIINLVADFESQYENGHVEYMSDKTIKELIDFYEAENKLDRAIEVLEVSIEQYPYQSSLMLQKARLLLCENRMEECLQTIYDAENLSPFDRDLMLLKVKAYSLSKKTKKARQILETLQSNIVEGEYAVELLIAESYVHQGDKKYEAMYLCLKKALRIDCSNKEALSRFWDAVDFARKYEDSIYFHKSLIDEQPYNFLAWYNLGLSYSYSHEYEKAIEALEYSFIINPNFESAYIECAEICLQQQDYIKALDIYNEMIAKFGQDSDILVSIASVLISLGKVDQAKVKLHKALKLDPYNEEAYFLLGKCFASNGVWYNAINAFYKAIDLDNNREEYYLELAKAYAKVEDYNKATLNFHKAATLASEDVYYWKEYVCFIIKLGLYDEALELLDEAEDFTYGAELLYCRAITYFFKKKKKAGLEALAEALEEDFEKYSIIYSLAPELEIDSEINAMIKYYEKEFQEYL
ncbi:MAG TPA: tetratricopeptide repeat protein [Saprospiraceae bacterium]|nr:tetratricopeptide repeat protein [Saprospiraceae bacterium]